MSTSGAKRPSALKLSGDVANLPWFEFDQVRLLRSSNAKVDEGSTGIRLLCISAKFGKRVDAT